MVLYALVGGLCKEFLLVSAIMPNRCQMLPQCIVIYLCLLYSRTVFGKLVLLFSTSLKDR